MRVPHQLVLFFLLLFAGHLQAQDFTLPEIYQESAQPLLGDLLQAANPQAIWNPSQTIPSLGNQAGYLSFAAVRELIPLPAGTTLVGSGLIFLPAAGLAESEKDFVLSLIRYLLTLKDNDDVSFTLEGVNLPRQLPENPEFRVQGGSKKLGFYNGRLQIQGRRAGSSWNTGASFAATIKSSVPMPVVLHDIASRTAINRSDWDWRQKDLTSVSGRVLTPQELEDNLISLRYIHEGEILREGSSKVVLPVNRYDSVRVIIVRGAVTIEITGQAQEEGRIGQKIRVTLPGRKTIDAEILREKEVRAEVP